MPDLWIIEDSEVVLEPHEFLDIQIKSLVETHHRGIYYGIDVDDNGYA